MTRVWQTVSVHSRYLGLGHIAGVSLRAHWSAFVLLGVLTAVGALVLLPATAHHTTTPGAWGWYWVAAGIMALGVLAGLLVHELAHALTARRHGTPTARITLWALGGSTETTAEVTRPRAEFEIALAGPASSLALGGAYWGLAALAQPLLPPLALVTVLWLAFTQLIVATFTALPAAPLDGGRMLTALLWHRRGDRYAAARTAARSGHLLGVALLALGSAEVILFGQFIGVWLAVVGWLVVGGAGARRRIAELGAACGTVPLRVLVRADQRVAPAWWTVAAFLEHGSVPERGAVPVVSFNGSVVGVVDPARLRRLPAARRAATRLADVCRKPPSVPVLHADTPLSAALAHGVGMPSGDALLVARGTTFVGMLHLCDLGLTGPVGR